jgi:hypothetical protein
MHQKKSVNLKPSPFNEFFNIEKGQIEVINESMKEDSTATDA